MAASVANYKVTGIERLKVAGMNVNLVRIYCGLGGADTFKYETGGLEFNPVQFGVNVVKHISGMTELGHQANYVYDAATKKHYVELFTSGGTELANDNAALDTKAGVLVVMGY